MATPLCLSCVVSMKELGNAYVCPGCGATKDIPQETEQHFSLPIAEKVELGKKKETRPRKEKGVVKSVKIGNFRIVTLENGHILKFGPRPQPDYFP